MNKRLSLILFFALFLSALSWAQSLSGIITYDNGDAVPYATVYINEIRHGTTANIKGEYLINLDPGSYTIFFQSLGFSPTIKNVTITDQDLEMDITLSIQYYIIPEVRITSTGEDPAYAIMRKAIGLSPYYLNQVDYYKAEVYIKGSFVLRKIPKIMQRNLAVNEEDIKVGEAYIIESINEIEFNAPDKYVQRIIAQQSTLPDAGNTDVSPMDVVKASFYQPVLADVAISPLAPNAFAHYKYRYEGSTPQGKYVINKISVIPRRKSQQVFYGTIYIIEDLWCLHSLDLSNDNLAGTINIKQVYTPIIDDIWMPVSHMFDINVSIVGVKGDGEYGSAITYNSVQPNTELEKPSSIGVVDYTIDESLLEEKPLSQDQEKIEKILDKGELSNRDMAKLSRLMNKEAKESTPDNASLEIVSTRDFSVDEEANKRDSTYWNGIRPIPLSDEEFKSIRVSDSLKTISSARLARRAGEPGDSTELENDNRFLRTLSHISFGRTFRNNDNSFSASYGGILNIDKINFNTVEGFYYGTDVLFRKRWENETVLRILPGAEWAFASNRIRWRVNGSFHYNRMKMAQFMFWTGEETRDFNRSRGISPTLNMATSLMFKDNYLKLYNSKYATIAHRHEIKNGLYAEFRYDFERRNLVNNNTDFSFWKKDESYEPNIPSNSYLPNPVISSLPYGLQDHDRHSGMVQITWIPRQRYRISNGIKSPAGSDFPTFKLDYLHGQTVFQDNTQEGYDRIMFEVSQNKSVGAFAEYSWRLKTGGFLNNDGVQFQDFIHFNSQPLPLLLTNYRDVFMLPAYYSMSTPDYFAEAHFRFTTPYLLIKLLPILSNTLMRENVSIAYLYTPAVGHYTELGYAISEILLLGRIGVYVGFDNLKYQSTGFRFTFIFD
jgi:hypothetical protein